MKANGWLLRGMLGATIVAAAFVVQGVAADEWGDWKGRFVYDGPAPTPAKLDIDKNLETFGALGLSGH